MEDLDLTQTLEAQKVEIRGQVESNGGILGFLLTWVLPMVLIVGLWFWILGRNEGEEKGDNWEFTAKEDGKLKVTYTNDATQEVNLKSGGKLTKDGPTVVACGVSE